MQIIHLFGSYIFSVWKFKQLSRFIGTSEPLHNYATSVQYKEKLLLGRNGQSKLNLVGHFSNYKVEVLYPGVRTMRSTSLLGGSGGTPSRKFLPNKHSEIESETTFNCLSLNLIHIHFNYFSVIFVQFEYMHRLFKNNQCINWYQRAC